MPFSSYRAHLSERLVPPFPFNSNISGDFIEVMSHNSAEYLASLDRAWSDLKLHVYSPQVKRIEGNGSSSFGV